MSTPTEKNPELAGLSDYAPRQVREQVSSPTHPVAGENDSFRSPYAPKPAAERAAARLRRRASDENDEPPEPAPSEMRRRIVADHDLARIEASLRLLQRQQNAGVRLPSGPNIPLPPGSGLAAGSAADEGSGERVLAWLSRPRSLEPTILPPPPIKPARKLHMSLALAVAFLLGGGLFYALLPAPPLPSAADTESNFVTRVAPSFPARTNYAQEPSQSAAASQTVSEEQEPISQASSTQVELARSDASEPNDPSPAAVISARHALAKAEIADQEKAAPSPSRSAVPALKAEDIDALIRQGEKFMADGDVVTARLLFERAAKAENATAALALAAAYDPVVLAKLGVLGVDTDVEKARHWYEKAQSLGSVQAVERLRALAER